MTPAIAFDREARLREDQIHLGLWLFLATVTMLFAAFTSAYIVRRSGADWRHVSLPAVLWLNTLLLAASSVALEGARWGATKRQQTMTRIAFAAAIALGLGFLAGQVVGWRELRAAGVYLPSSPHSSFFYVLTGAHALHVVAALAVLVWGATKALGNHRDRQPQEWTLALSVCRTFWHYLGAVWAYLFVLMSVW